MILYHGSNVEVKEPKIYLTEYGRDFGPAFYLTLDLEAAKSWACKNDSLGIVNKYHIDNESYKRLNILDLTNKDKYSILNWMAILIHFRTLDTSFIKNNQLVLDWLNKYYIDVNDYDVVIGFRADDAYFRFPSRFISNDLAFEDLENIYLSGDLGVQYAFISKRAIKLLKFDSVIECEKSFLGLYYSIISFASKEFDELLNKPKDPNKNYVLDLMRKENEH